MKVKEFTKFEIILGLVSLAVLGLVVMPPLNKGLVGEKNIRAVAGAETIARAVLDYRSDTGHWPSQPGEVTDLSCLTRTNQSLAEVQPLVGTLGGGDLRDSRGSRQADFRPWLREIPLDPWHRPYRVAILATGSASGDVIPPAAQSRTGVYSLEPPPGVAICVISAGPDGTWNTDLNQWSAMTWHKAASRTAGMVTPLPSTWFGGDDLGFILTGQSRGGGS